MANIVRGVLGSAGMKLGLGIKGESGVGLAVAGDWAGRISFRASQDGHNYAPVMLTPFPSGTPVNGTTGNGTWVAVGRSGVAVEAVLDELTSGAPSVTLSASADESYQDAFLASTQRHVCQRGEAGAENRLTVPARNTGPWRLRSLVVSFDAAAAEPPDATVPVTVYDGEELVLWHVDIPTARGFIALPLPADPGEAGSVGGGLVVTPGNDLVVLVGAAGADVTSTINAEVSAA